MKAIFGNQYVLGFLLASILFIEILYVPKEYLLFFTLPTIVILVFLASIISNHQTNKG